MSKNQWHCAILLGTIVVMCMSGIVGSCEPMYDDDPPPLEECPIVTMHNFRPCQQNRECGVKPRAQGWSKSRHNKVLQFGRNRAGMPFLLCNSLAFLVSSTDPEFQEFAGSYKHVQFRQAWYDWQRLQNHPTKEMFMQRLTLRRRWMDATALKVFDRIELFGFERKIVVVSHFTKCDVFGNRTDSGYYKKPYPEERDIYPFQLQDQWTMAGQYLMENGWLLTNQYRNEDVPIMRFERW